MEGDLSAQQRWRADAAVAEFYAGRAPRVLFSGGAVANDFVEADVMAREAVRLGVPPSAILEDRKARTTVENISASEKILRDHGWNRVEVVTSPDHAHRAAVLLAQTDLVWRVVAAPTPGRALVDKAAGYAQEAVATSLLRWFGTGAEPVIHRTAGVLQSVEHWVRQRVWQLRHRSITWHANAWMPVVGPSARLAAGIFSRVHPRRVDL